MTLEDHEQQASATTTTAVATSSDAVAAAASASPASRRIGNAKGPSTFIGRHRLQAAISHLDQQIRVIQDELNELDTLGGPSTVCNELISKIESVPDPLLPVTRGPVDVSWERWFGGGDGRRTHRRWI